MTTAEVVSLRQPDPLARLEAAYGALELASTLEEVKQLRDMAEAARTYARAARLGIAAQNTAAAFKVRAERKAGELLAADPRIQRGGQTDRQSVCTDLGIAHHQSSRWQRLATIPEDTFEGAVTSTVDAGRELTTASLLQLARVVSGGSVGGDRELPPLPEGTFRVVVADPPWQYGNGATRNAARKHYPTMTVAEVCALGDEVQERAAGESHLYLWTTNSFLREAFDVVDAWGFDYKTCLTWVKPQMGLGNYFRSATEHILFGVRGGLRTESRSLVNWFEASRARHSAKPQHFYELVERASQGPYLEMFARTRRLGWTGWGNES